MVSISKYPQWISKRLKDFIFSYKCEKKFKVFHKANKLSFNITWIHNRTLNVIPYFQDRALCGRAACCVTNVQLWDKWWTHVLSIRVERSIIKHVLIIEQFPIFSTFLNQIEWFLCSWMCKLKGYKCFFSIRNKGATQKT
jgi:hypothetical protein